ncbi:MAG: alpha/beta hydrolase [Bacteroidetes bacterium]|nr:alpha/beta hydrolase [Bacteroidota bacterium]
MKKIILLFIFLLAASGMNAQEVTGDWAGYLNVQGVKLKIVFHILRNEGKMTSTFDSPDQNAMGLKIDEASLNGSELSLNARSLGILYQGTVNKAMDTITGFWIQGGGKLPLILERTKMEVINKPVNPYESDIVLKTVSGDIMGTLTLPDKASGIPVVLIIAGSGPTDRDGNSPPALKNTSNCYKLLAEELRKNGIASVRYDKRGIAGSKSAATKESDLHIENYISDAKGWVELLVKDKRFSKIIVAGHSEGSLIGMIACNQTKANGYISISGSGRPADEILKEQFGTLPQDAKDQIFPLLDKLKKGDTIGNVPADLNSFFRPSLQPYLISWFRYDPQAEIKKLKMPVLIIQGDMDIQVSVFDAELLSKANPKAELKFIRHMNHVLKDTDTKDKMEQVTKVYTNADLPLDKNFEDEVVKFIKTVK